ncbi:hypothetical protein V8E51_002187 [Hyaloscypha variabilis]
MPPRKRVRAPASRIYKSSTPLKQAKLTAASKRIRSYGKKSGVQLPKPDNTLTQMDWLKMQQMQEEKQLLEDEDGDEDFEVEVKKPKRKRRKTTGDSPSATPQLHTQTISQVWSIRSGAEEEGEDLGQSPEKESKKRKSKRRKTAGDKPSSTPQFHTQTLTQLDRSFNSAPEEDDRSIFDVPSSSRSIKASKRIKRGSAGKAKKPAVVVAPPPQETPARDMPPPQTPHRNMPQEIPSSQSPGTPVSLHSRGSTGRRSPLNNVSINAPIPFNTLSKPHVTPSQLPNLEVQNSSESGTHASQLSRIPTSPSKRSSPAKSVRFALPDVKEEVEEGEEKEPATPTIKMESTSYHISQSQSSSVRSTRTEIQDSDAESEDEIEVCDQLIASTITTEEEDSTEQEAEEEVHLQDATAQEDYEPHAETDSCYGDIGAETQFEAERIIDSPRSSGLTPAIQSHANSEPETFRERTQMMESQRLATQYLDTMAPRTTFSDIFISLPPQHVTEILSRARDHVIRAYSFPQTVSRVWIFETKPVSTLKYMAEISSAKRPGQIVDERGLENAKFNTRTGTSWAAYEILQLYELSGPLPWAKIKANEWLKEPPRKYDKVGPAVLDQLVANLKPPLFQAESDAPASSSTDTQEAEAQLLSTIKQFTQLASSALSQPISSQFVQPEIGHQEPLSSSYATPRTNGNMGAPASQATTVDLSQTQTPRQQSAIEVVWESPTRPVPSSTPLKLPTPLADGSQFRAPDSIMPYSMASSQLLTKSQLLPHSLLDESVAGPPLFVQDSDDEGELI